MDDSVDSVLDLLSGATADALRGERLPLLFQAASACTWEQAAQVALLVEKAFAGDAGLAALREQHAFLGQGVAHAEANVRAASLSQLRRLCSTATDVTLLQAHGLLPLVATAVGDAELAVAQHASKALVACSVAGPESLRVVLDDAPTIAAIDEVAGAAGDKQAAVRRLRVLGLWAEASAAGEAQCALLLERGRLSPLLPLLQDEADPLVRLHSGGSKKGRPP